MSEDMLAVLAYVLKAGENLVMWTTGISGEVCADYKIQQKDLNPAIRNLCDLGLIVLDGSAADILRIPFPRRAEAWELVNDFLREREKFLIGIADGVLRLCCRWTLPTNDAGPASLRRKRGLRTMFRFLLVFGVALLLGCSQPKQDAQPTMVGDWDDGGGHGMSATFFSDGTWTADGYAGHGHWRIEADKLYGVPSASDWDGTHYMVWWDENHLDLVDVKFMKRNDVSELSPAETARRFHGKLGIQSWVRICPATRHGNQYY